MSNTVFYRGKFKCDDSLQELINIASKQCDEYGWHYTVDEGIMIDVPDAETFCLKPDQASVKDFVKYLGNDEQVIYHIFEILRLIKPCFNRLMVFDDLGMWEDYIAQFSKEKLPELRELRDIEKEELSCFFDLPSGTDSIFGIEWAKASMMFMVIKDMSSDLEHVVTKDELLQMADPSYSCFHTLLPKDDIFCFISIVETWYMKCLRDKKGNSIVWNAKKENAATVFAWSMAEIIFGFWGGTLGSKHGKMKRFVRKITGQGYDLNDRETFLRFIYSAMEMLGAYRSEELIKRTGRSGEK